MRSITPLALLIVALAFAIIAMAAQPKSAPSARPSKQAIDKRSPKSKQPASKKAVPVPGKLAKAAARPVRTLPASLQLLYTASAGGQIRSCNCTKFRFGGYGREMTLLQALRAKGRDSMLIEGGDVCGDTGFQAELKAKVSAKALDLLAYDLMVPGEAELGVRGVRYIDKFAANSTPLICANLYKNGDSKPRLKPFVILKSAGGLRVGVIGLIGPSVCEPWLQASFGETVKSPSEVLPQILKQVRPQCDLVVVVYHGVIQPKDPLAGIAGIDLILASHKHSQDRLFPSKESNTVAAPVEKLGGAILIRSETSTNWCLGKLDLQLGPDARIESAKHELIYLDRSYEEAPAMVKIYDAYNEDVKNAVIASSAAFKKQAEALLTKRGLNLVQMRERLHKTTYATAAKCVDCHPQIHQIWSESRHARAMDTLRKTKQEFDPECVRCHTTGSMSRGGFTNAKDTPELGNVQCEACHGSGLQHIAAPAKGYGKVHEETCRSCHTDERTPDFHFPTAWAGIMH